MHETQPELMSPSTAGETEGIANRDAAPNLTHELLGTPDDTTLLRELVLQAHPNVVLELVRGETVAELLASVPEAQAAYARITEAAASANRTSSIPGGGTVRTATINVEGMSAMAKIRGGLGEVQGSRSKVRGAI